MKRNQLFVLLVLSLALSFVFIACNKTNVVGTWACEMTRTEFAAISETTTGMLQLAGIPEKFNIAELVFTADGKFSITVINPKDGTREVVVEGTYTVSGKTVAMTGGDAPLNVTVDGNKIILPNENMGGEMVFIKQ